ncbi:MAG: hypothetical protein JSW28_01650, partial [Thermoplasmata archaeon]
FVNISCVDDSGGFDCQSVVFIIENVNDPPVISNTDKMNLSSDISVTSGDTFYYKINVSDVDSDDSLTFSDNTDLFDIHPETGEISFTPSKEDAGTHTVTITVTDSQGNSDSFTMTFVIQEEEEEGFNDLLLLIPLVAIVIAIVILLLIFGRGKSGAKKEIVAFEQPRVIHLEEPEPESFKIQPPPPPPPAP